MEKVGLQITELDRTSWEILNATANDCENLEQIYRQVHPYLIAAADAIDKPDGQTTRYPESPLLAQIAGHIRELVEQKLLAIVMDENGQPWQDQHDLSYVWRAWFSRTPRGRIAWESAAHLYEPQQA